jgi:hypothetical protein
MHHIAHRPLRSALAILAATVGVAAFASSAEAVVVEREPVGMIGDPQEMLRDAWLEFDFDAGVMIPRVDGTLEVNDAAGSCFAVRITEYDGTTRLHSKRGTRHCVTDDNDHAFPINLDGVGDPLTDTVDVEIEQQTALGWSMQDGRELTMETSTDSVGLYGYGVDLGGFSFTNGGPISGATVSWPINAGLAQPTFDGYVHFDAFLACGRVRLRLLDEADALVEEVRGPRHCAPDAGYYNYHDVLAGTPSGLVTQMEVILERRSGGGWIEVDSDTVSIAE